MRPSRCRSVLVADRFGVGGLLAGTFDSANSKLRYRTIFSREARSGPVADARGALGRAVDRHDDAHAQHDGQHRRTAIGHEGQGDADHRRKAHDHHQVDRHVEEDGGGDY